MEAQPGAKTAYLIYMREAGKYSKLERSLQTPPAILIWLGCGFWYNPLEGASSIQTIIQPVSCHHPIHQSSVCSISTSHLFLLFSGASWCPATSFWFPGETACILFRERQKKKTPKKQIHQLISVVQCLQHILIASDCALLTFGMVFVQLISRLLPFLNPVLERCDQAFQESAAVAQGVSQEKFKHMTYLCIAARFWMSTEVTKKIHLLGEVAQFSFNASVPHTHPCQSWANIPGGTLEKKVQ